MVKLLTLLGGLIYKFCTLYNAKERFAQSQIILSDRLANNKPVQMVIVAVYKFLTQIRKSLNIF